MQCHMPLPDFETRQYNLEAQASASTMQMHSLALRGCIPHWTNNIQFELVFLHKPVNGD